MLYSSVVALALLGVGLDSRDWVVASQDATASTATNSSSSGADVTFRAKAHFGLLQFATEGQTYVTLDGVNEFVPAWAYTASALGVEQANAQNRLTANSIAYFQNGQVTPPLKVRRAWRLPRGRAAARCLATRRTTTTPTTTRRPFSRWPWHLWSSLPSYSCCHSHPAVL